jgi:hypothetical protein
MTVRKALHVEVAPAYHPHDFVYCGMRIGHNGNHLVAMHLIRPDGEMGARRLYAYKRAYDRTIGAIYTGAQFAEGDLGARDLSQARYVRMWDNRTDLIRWEALHHSARVVVAQQRVEAAHGHLIDTTVAPLHDVYHELLQAGDDDAVIALELAVVQSLRKRGATA